MHDAPKKTWIKQFEDYLKQRRLTLEQAKVRARDHKALIRIVDQDGDPTAHTVTYMASWTTSPAKFQLGTKDREEESKYHM